MSREEIFEELKPLLDSLYGENEYGFFIEKKYQEIGYQHLFGIPSSSYPLGQYSGHKNTPGVFMKTCTVVERGEFIAWSNFFCLLLQKEISVQVKFFKDGCRLYVSPPNQGGLTDLLGLVGIEESRDFYLVVNLLIWVYELN